MAVATIQPGSIDTHDLADYCIEDRHVQYQSISMDRLRDCDFMSMIRYNCVFMTAIMRVMQKNPDVWAEFVKEVSDLNSTAFTIPSTVRFPSIYEEELIAQYLEASPMKIEKLVSEA